MKKPYVLIVDDDELARDTISEVISKKCDFVAVSGGEDAISKIAESLVTHKYDVMLLDIRMPGLDGIETLEKIKSKFPTTDLEIIMLTAFDEAKYAWEAAKLGANDYITKPFSNDDLLLRVILAAQRKWKLDDTYRKAFLTHEILIAAKKGGILEKRGDLYTALFSKYQGEIEKIPLQDVEEIYAGKWDEKRLMDVSPGDYDY